MPRLIVVAIVALLLGVVAGSSFTRQSMQARAPQLAVMWSAQFHVQAWRAALQVAAQPINCAAASLSAQRLQSLSQDMALVFPAAEAQEQEFRRYRQQLLQSLQPAGAGQCQYDAAMLQRVQRGCDDCHRQYR